MDHLQSDFGRRVIRAAHLAVAMHIARDNQQRSKAIGRRAATGNPGLRLVTDDAPSSAVENRSPWTLAGEDPAGSFAA